ncbi:MBL fold metallo-hydrolase [Marinobacterium sp. LSUCC0821]|uniref:MBL fold metallo-hydrolase n=1 Tax=Marinobacterium sp. LSUCC0821 TaxID=2668067 RepID=UPI00145154DD|nr:MBL fold metallo-hydrolase [Marinobacterium sp. LSUCC0821]QJD72173.1 MBL fold metallo-hydrolase [Marinobacterium sp. LSUCC0821]
MIKIKNYTNACVTIEGKNEKIIIDPWFYDGIYQGTWHNFPRLSENQKIEAFTSVTFCLYTHLHKDHFCIETAKKYCPKDMQFLVPRVFGWQVMSNTLKEAGFNNVNVLECSAESFLTEEFDITAVPPINVTGLESQKENSMSIDAGFSIICRKNGIKLVFLAGDNLYSAVRISENIKILNNPDLIGFAYSGFASDFPFKYRFNFEEKLKILRDKEKVRFELQVDNLKLLSPKCVMPYSSEFVAVGGHAAEWRRVIGEVWTCDKFEVARRYGKALNADFVALYPEDTIIFDENGARVDYLNSSFESGESIFKEMINYSDSLTCSEGSSRVFKNTVRDSEFDFGLLELAAKNYSKAIKKHSLEPKQEIIISIDGDRRLHLDKEGSLKDINGDAGIDPFIIVDVNAGILKLIIDGDLHWDDACLSMKLNWHREPNFFCSDTLNALNYFRL